MATIKAKRCGNDTPVDVLEHIPMEVAKSLASQLMALICPPYTISSGATIDVPYCRVDIFYENGEYCTTAWGE